MKARDFRALVDQLGDLSETQRSIIMDAISSKGSAGEVIAMIKNRFATDPRRGHCRSASIGPW